MPQTRFVLRKAFERRSAAHRRHQQDRSPATPGPRRCSTPSSTCSSNWAPTTTRSISPPSTPPAGRESPPRTSTCPATDIQSALRGHLQHVPAPRRSGRSAANAASPLRLQRLRRPHRHRPRVAGTIRKGQRIALLEARRPTDRQRHRSALRLRPPGPGEDRRGRAPAISVPWSASTRWTSATPSPTRTTPWLCRRSRWTSRRWT